MTTTADRLRPSQLTRRVEGEKQKRAFFEPAGRRAVKETTQAPRGIAALQWATAKTFNA